MHPADQSIEPNCRSAWRGYSRILRSALFLLVPSPADVQLHQKGLSLRVREIGRHHVQTIKQENSGNTALFARGEWEHNVSAKQPDLDAARNTALALLLNKKLRDA